MDGETLYRKAQNGGKGFPPWDKLSPQQKGLWTNASIELRHEQARALGHGHKEELECVLAWIRTRALLFYAESGRESDAIRSEAARTIGKCCTDVAERLERGEHT